METGRTTKAEDNDFGAEFQEAIIDYLTKNFTPIDLYGPEYIRENYHPSDVFDAAQLEEWALSNGFVEA